MLMLLAVMLAGCGSGRAERGGGASRRSPTRSSTSGSTQGKVASVVLDGEVVDATLKSPETLDGRTVKTFRTNVPANDSALLPLLREKGVQIMVKSQKQPFAVQMLFTLLPWALIIGVWFWMSRRAQGMLGTGGPLGGS